MTEEKGKNFYNCVVLLSVFMCVCSVCAFSVLNVLGVLVLSVLS